MSQISLLNSSNLIDSQILKLLKELQVIFNQKWVLLNNEGFNYIENLFEIFQNFRDIFEKRHDISNKSNSNINNEVDFINKCNDINEKLVDVINNYELQIKRVNEIKMILFDINRNNTIEIVNVAKKYIDKISSQFNEDYNLKVALVKRLIFKSRLNRTDQVSLISCWMHEPSIEFINILKFNNLIDNYNKS
jgi:hypothetical protein